MVRIMAKFWEILFHEYTRHILRKRFIFVLLSIPLMIGVLTGVAILATVLSINTSPIGYVDQSGFLAAPISLPPSNDLFTPQVKFLAFPDVSAANSA